MKSKRLKLLPIFLTLPFLMANSPGPMVYESAYKDYKLSFISQEKVEDGTYKQHFTLENTGKGYISRIYLDDVYSEDYYGSYMHDFNPYYPFVDRVFEPGFNQEIVLSSSMEMPDFKKVKSKAEGFADFAKDIKINGTKEITLVSEPTDTSSYSYYYYKINLELQLPDTYYEYGAILKLNYKSSTCYIEVSEGRNYHYETNEKLDLTELSVQDVITIKSEPYLSHQLGCGGDFSNVLTIFLIVFVVFALFISFGIFAAIFFPAMGRRRRRRRLALQQQQKEQNEKESQ